MGLTNFGCFCAVYINVKGTATYLDLQFPKFPGHSLGFFFVITFHFPFFSSIQFPSAILWLVSVLTWVGNLLVVPRQLHGDDPHRRHLAHPLPRHLEVGRGQVDLAKMEIARSRFIMMKFPSKAVTLCTVQGCKFVLIVGYGGRFISQIWKLLKAFFCILINHCSVLPLLLTLPNMFFVRLTSTTTLAEGGESCYTLHHLEIKWSWKYQPKCWLLKSNLESWGFNFLWKTIFNSAAWWSTTMGWTRASTSHSTSGCTGWLNFF